MATVRVRLLTVSTVVEQERREQERRARAAAMRRTAVAVLAAQARAWVAASVGEAVREASSVRVGKGEEAAALEQVVREVGTARRRSQRNVHSSTSCWGCD